MHFNNTFPKQNDELRILGYSNFRFRFRNLFILLFFLRSQVTLICIYLKQLNSLYPPLRFVNCKYVKSDCSNKMINSIVLEICARSQARTVLILQWRAETELDSYNFWLSLNFAKLFYFYFYEQGIFICSRDFLINHSLNMYNKSYITDFEHTEI